MMSDTTHSSGTALRVTRHAGRVATVAVVANLLVYVMGRVAGVDFRVVSSGGAEFAVGPPSIVLVTVVAVAAGALVLGLVARRTPRAWLSLAWVGLGLAVLSVAMPLTTESAMGTKAALAGMHVLTGVTWFVGARRQSNSSGRGDRI